MNKSIELIHDEHRALAAMLSAFRSLAGEIRAGRQQADFGLFELMLRYIEKLPAHKRLRQGLALVPEGRGIFPNLSVRENLQMSARAGLDGQCNWTFERVMETFPRLGERINNGGWQLSGGEQQMLTIGRALMTNPDLLILDEATEGLAPLIAMEIWRIVKEIRKTGIATVIVDKNHGAVTSICDRAMILVKGEVVFSGTSDAIRAEPELIQKHLGV